jgi:hypothetical protein
MSVSGALPYFYAIELRLPNGILRSQRANERSTASLQQEHSTAQAAEPGRVGPPDDERTGSNILA